MYIFAPIPPALSPPSGTPRPMHGANMMLELKRWLETAFPYWKVR